MEERIETRIGAQIGMLSNLLSRQTACMSKACGDESITRMQAIIIHYLLVSEKNGDCFQRDIERAFRMRRSTATGILQLMERHGLICREPVARDARLKRLVLTERARDLDERIQRSIAVNETIMREGVDERDLETWFSVSRKICANLEAHQSRTLEETL